MSGGAGAGVRTGPRRILFGDRVHSISPLPKTQTANARRTYRMLSPRVLPLKRVMASLSDRRWRGLAGDTAEVRAARAGLLTPILPSGD